MFNDIARKELNLWEQRGTIGSIGARGNDNNDAGGRKTLVGLGR